jgi:hypothetical protein
MPLLEEVTLTAHRQLDQTAQYLAAAALPEPELKPVLKIRQDLARISLQPDRLMAVRAARVPPLEAARPLLDALAGMPGKPDVRPLDALHDVLLREVVSFQSVCRLNIVGLTLTAVSIIAIELIKDKEWQAWFQSQPFRTAKSSNDGTWFNKLMQPTPHKSEAYMLSKLDAAIGEVKGD